MAALVYHCLLGEIVIHPAMIIAVTLVTSSIVVCEELLSFNRAGEVTPFPADELGICIPWEGMSTNLIPYSHKIIL